MKTKIVFLFARNNITTNYSIVPFYLWEIDKNKKKLYDIHYCVSELNKKASQGDLLIIIRRYENVDLSDQLVEKELKHFKKNFKKVIYFDDSAALSKINWFIVNRVDMYCKRGLLRDRDLYKKTLYGGRLFSDYYHKKYKIYDQKENNTLPDYSNKYDWNKIEIAWNIGIGMYELNSNILKIKFNYYLKKSSKYYCQLINSDINKFIVERNIKKIIKSLNLIIDNIENLNTMGRITNNGYSQSVGFQRKLISKELNDRNIETKKISYSSYLGEMYKYSSFISPFGWGEICFRDFESIILGKMLIKPNCDHIITWPNIYQDNMYVPIDWEASNLDFALNGLSKEKRLEIINNSRSYYKLQLQKITGKVNQIIEKALG